MYRLYFILFCCLATHGLVAQINDADIKKAQAEMAVNDSLMRTDTVLADKFYTKKRFDLNRNLDEQLPSLADLIEIAIDNHPSVKFQEENITSSEYQIQYTKRQWQNNVVGSVNYFGGSQNQVNVVSSEAIQSSVLGNGFRYGVTVNVPLFEFSGRKSRIRLYEHQTKSYVHKREVIELEVSRQVIKEYTYLVSMQRTLKIEAQFLEQAKLNLENVKMAFQRGDADITEWSRISEIEKKSRLDFEFARREYFNSYYQFEKLLGVDLDTLVR